MPSLDDDFEALTAAQLFTVTGHIRSTSWRSCIGQLLADANGWTSGTCGTRKRARTRGWHAVGSLHVLDTLFRPVHVCHRAHFWQSASLPRVVSKDISRIEGDVGMSMPTQSSVLLGSTRAASL